MKKLIKSAVCVGAMAIFSVPASAAVVVTTAKSDVGTPPAFSTTDLGQSQFLSSTGLGGGEASSLSGQLFSGFIGDTNGGTGDPGEVTLAATSSITLNLDTSVNTLGYDITGIDTIFGWNPGAGGRSNQGYDIALGFVGGGSATLVNSQHWEPNSPSSYWTEVRFSNDGGGTLFSDTVNLNGAGAVADLGVLATGVNSITWNIDNDAPPGGVVVAREFDIFGTATVAVPEPASATALALLGMGALFNRRRR